MRKLKIIYPLRNIHIVCLIHFISTGTISLSAQNSRPGISADGRYVFARYQYPGIDNALLIESTVNNWKQEIHAKIISQPAFTADGERLIYQKNGDTVCIVHLGTMSTDIIAGAINVNLPTNDLKQ